MILDHQDDISEHSDPPSDTAAWTHLRIMLFSLFTTPRTCFYSELVSVESLNGGCFALRGLFCLSFFGFTLFILMSVVILSIFFSLFLCVPLFACFLFPSLSFPFLRQPHTHTTQPLTESPGAPTIIHHPCFPHIPSVRAVIFIFNSY